MKKHCDRDLYCGITGKVCYTTIREVNFAIDLSKKYNNNLKHYKCNFCGYLHLTKRK